MGYLLADQIAERVLPLKHAQKAALVLIARYGDNDGRNMRPSALRVAIGLGSSVSHAERMHTQLRASGWLLDDGWHGHVRNRRIPVERLATCPLVDDEYQDQQPAGLGIPKDPHAAGKDPHAAPRHSEDTVKTWEKQRGHVLERDVGARQPDLDRPDDWSTYVRRWETGWRLELANVLRESGLAKRGAGPSAKAMQSIAWRMRDGYGVDAIALALCHGGELARGRARTVPWILHADKIDAAIDGDIGDDWLESNPFT